MPPVVHGLTRRQETAMNVEPPFHRIKIRVAAAIFHGGDIALIRRTNSSGITHYSLPGGNVEPAEGLLDALGRELLEELGLDLQRIKTSPQFTWMLDAMVNRPGAIPPRKIHLVYRLHLAQDDREGLRTHEYDELGEGTILWLPYRQTGEVHLFPPVPVWQLSSPASAVDATSCMLPPIDDSNFEWR